MGESIRPGDAGQAERGKRGRVFRKTVDDATGSRENSNGTRLKSRSEPGISPGQEEKHSWHPLVGAQLE
jgi:hypothetical protein